MNREEAVKRFETLLLHVDTDCVMGMETTEAIKMAIKALEQPDPCADTIDVLNESIKHFDDMAEECRRNANIERNDYMDMRDDAAEYRQLSIWLNELKWLRERFQSRLEQRWIPVTERLPEDEYVLISKKPTKISGDKWSVTIAIRTADPRNGKIEWRDIGFGVIPDDKVLAWMPLPEPYREEGGE